MYLIQRHPISLSNEFQDILKHLETTNDSFLITGKAGTGKSTLLSIFRRTSRKRIAVVAPTGIAALNVKGQTIHSFFKLPPRMLMPKDIHKAKNRKIYKNLETLVIDEISMVRADLLDNIDRFLRLNRDNPEPFGGVQLLLFGDMFQLPPVVASAFERHIFQSQYETPYFFSAKVMASYDLPMIELNEVYRQKDRHFVSLLDRVRTNDIDREDIELLNSRVTHSFTEDDIYITLTSINASADAINRSKLAKIDAKSYKYTARIDGKFNPSQYPTEQLLELKVGAQVMFVKNDMEKRFVNGTLGKVIDLSEESVTVGIEDSDGVIKNISLDKEEWEILQYKVDKDNPKKFSTEVIGAFVQYPLKLAWAITIHKSQGQTFDRVRIDMGRGAFEFGQTYVALSRCRTLEGIELSKPLTGRDVMSDERITEYYQHKRFYY